MRSTCIHLTCLHDEYVHGRERERERKGEKRRPILDREHLTDTKSYPLIDSEAR